MCDLYRLISITPCGDDGLLVDFGDLPESNARVRVAVRHLQNARPDYVEEAIAGVNTLAVVLPALWRDAERRLRAEESLAQEIEHSFSTDQPAGREVVLPVCYDASMAPDLPLVAEHTGLSPNEIVQLHQSARYEAELVGFMPGFAYLRGLSPRLNGPRLPSPRAWVPAGALGITGSQCAVYPTATPGGWNLIGRCPLQLFDPHRTAPALIALGDIVQFESISVSSFERLWSQR